MGAGDSDLGRAHAAVGGVELGASDREARLEVARVELEEELAFLHVPVVVDEQPVDVRRDLGADRGDAARQ